MAAILLGLNVSNMLSNSFLVETDLYFRYILQTII